MVVIRYLFVLLIGALAGAIGLGVALQKGYGDVFLKNAPTVADLERRLDEMEQERNRLGRQLESVEGRAAKMERLFTELETRFRGLSAAGTGAPEPVPAPSVAADPPPAGAATPPGGEASDDAEPPRADLPASGGDAASAPPGEAAVP